MKRFLIASCILLALFVSAAGAAPAAHATAADTNNSNIQLDSQGNPTGNNTGVVADPFADAAKSASEAAKAAANTPTKGPGPTPPTTATLNGVMAYIAQLFAWLLGVAAILLDNVVFYTIVKMGTYVSSLSAVGVTWRIIRDVGNIMFVFGFLSVGIMTILNVEWFGIKKMLPMLLVGAIFLNFSLFISEAIVDTGNLFATQFYQQINGGNPAGAKKSIAPPAINNEGISNRIMSSLGLQTIYGEIRNSDPDKVKTYMDNSGIIGFMSIILFLIAAFVFFSLAFILIARFVALVFLIIASPIGFAGLAIPGFANLAKQWWKNLYDQTMVAPVLLLMLYVALAVITDAKFLTGFSDCVPGSAVAGGCQNPSYISFATSDLGGFATVILSFLVAMGLLLLVLVYAKRWSAFGGDWATKTAGKMTFGLTGWAVNRTAGRAAYYGGRRLQQIPGFNKVDAWTGRLVSRGLNRAATGSFDLRGTGVLAKIPFGDTIKPGEAAKDGFVGARKRTIENHEKAAKAIEEAHKEGFSDRERKEAVDSAIALAEASKSTKITEHTAAQGEVEEQKHNVGVLKREITELEKAEREQRITPEEEQRLSSARADLTTAESTLVKSQTKLNKAAGDLEKATSDLKKIKEKDSPEQQKAVNDALTGKIKQSKIAYGEGLTIPSPINLFMSGPATSAAGRKIIRDAKTKKSTAQQLAELATKAAKEAEDTESKSPSQAPATQAPPAAAPH